MPIAIQRHAGMWCAALVVAAILRIVSTYGVFSQTYDEPWHIAGGVEWLHRGSYNIGLEHPPLARVVVALGPWLMGARSQGAEDPNYEGNDILYRDGRYWRHLAAARAGTLVFFAIGCAFVFLWARRWFGDAQALLAVLLFTTLPPVLGHSGMATIDVAQAATLMAALYSLLRWLENRTPGWAVLAGLAFGLAVLAKFSNLMFYAVCCVPLALVRPRLMLVRHAALGVLAASLTIWAGYRCSLRPLSESDPLRPIAARHFGENSRMAHLAARVDRIPIPFSEFGAGLMELYHHNSRGHDSFLLGEYRRTGWWQFFPVVLAVKTPLSFLLLAAAGCWMARRRLSPALSPRGMTLWFPAAILLVCLSSRIDLGVRHAISIYPLLCILIAHAAAQMIADPRAAVRASAAALILLAIVESAAAHPDYLASFNLLAGRNPERILCESDLDWGQDLRRLAVRLKELGAPSVSISYFGTARLTHFGLPELLPLSRTTPATGHVAISAHSLVIDHAKDGSYDWLRRHRPLERVGKSIFLFEIPSQARQ